MIRPRKEAQNPRALPRSPQHKFKIGQLVHYHPKKTARFRHEGLPWLYQITRLLPAIEDGEFQYEIRSTLEEHDRVARESELARN
jgi:hypothetical protein